MHRASKKLTRPEGKLRVCELFAGVGGFHLGLARAGLEVVWANQWEPGAAKQHAFDCYERHFPGLCVNRDIALVIDDHQKGASIGGSAIPEHDVLVGGFPCQDYSVAKPLSMASGIRGKKGVLWWEIRRWLFHFRPGYLLLENVDRLLKSPSKQRGRDFAVMLICLAELGYEVEWRVINAADYGYPQKRRRVFIVGRHRSVVPRRVQNPLAWITSNGILARACRCVPRALAHMDQLESGDCSFWINKKNDYDPVRVTRNFGRGNRPQGFRNAGYMRRGEVWTLDVDADYSGKRVTLGDVLLADDQVPAEYWVDPAAVTKWKYLKGPKAERRVHPKTGFEYFYSEGGIPFPDRIDAPARTILTGEGGATPSRFKHLVRRATRARYRRLTPIELERLNGFPDEWTEGMLSGRRAFCMGNALVVPLISRIGRELAAFASRDRVRATGKASRSRPRATSSTSRGARP